MPRFVDDQERHGAQRRHALFARADECGLRELFERAVRLAIDDAAALGDGFLAQRLREMTLPGPRWSDQQHAAVSLDAVRDRERDQWWPLDFRSETPIEICQRLDRSNARLVQPARKRAIRVARQFIFDQQVEKIEAHAV